MGTNTTFWEGTRVPARSSASRNRYRTRPSRLHSSGRPVRRKAGGLSRVKSLRANEACIVVLPEREQGRVPSVQSFTHDAKKHNRRDSTQLAVPCVRGRR